MLQQGVLVTLGIFIVGLVYHAGQMAQRLTIVERDQQRLYDELRRITTSIDEIKGMIRGDAQ